MGCSAAYYLAQTGAKVVLLEQFTIEGANNASQDYSRAFRLEYGTDEFYTKLALESLELWRELERKSGRQLYFPCGALLLGKDEKDRAMESYKTLRRLGCEASLCDREELAKRYPQFRAEYGVLDHAGGVLEASGAVETFAELARAAGVTIQENTQVARLESGRATLDSGKVIKAEKVVVATGNWTRKLLPQLPIRSTKQQLVYFKPSSPQEFTKSVFPAFAYLEEGFYGFPIHGIGAVKLANHMPGDAVDPDDMPREASKEFIAEARRFLTQFIPRLADAEIIKSKVCLYDMSTDSDFIVDFVDENILILGGFSGHGFKFAPKIGQLAAAMLDHGEPPPVRFKFTSR